MLEKNVLPCARQLGSRGDGRRRQQHASGDKAYRTSKAGARSPKRDRHISSPVDSGESPDIAQASVSGKCYDGGESDRIVTRLLIADESHVVRHGLRAMLEARPNWEVVADAADGKEAILKAFETKPDIAVIDYLLPLVNGVEVTRQIRARLRKTEVLVFANDDSEALIAAPLKAGARGYLTTSEVQRYLIEAIESLAIHKPFFTASINQILLESFLAKTTFNTLEPGTRCPAANHRRTLE